MMPVLVVRPARLARRRSSIERSYLACGRTTEYMRRTVSMLWLRMSGSSSRTRSRASQSPQKSGIRTSMLVSGALARTSRIVSAHTGAPPSLSSSRFTEVMTMCFRRMRATVSPTRRGSSRSSVGGRPVAMWQNPQERVQTSPRIMIVAVPRDQHSPMLGHLADSQTV